MANRPSAPDALAEELERALDLIARQPGIGTRARSTRAARVRRIYLARVRYHLYYHVLGDVIEVLALWHTSRGSGPDL